MNNKKYYEILSEKDIKAIGGRISADEEFKAVPAVKGWFISSEGRLISKRKGGNVKLVKTYFTGGYEHVTTRVNDRTGRFFTIHQLVAQAFLTVPEWIKPGDIIEIHHLIRVNRKKRIAGSHAARNLSYMPKTIHKTVDVIADIAVNEGGLYRQYDFVTAAERMGISTYTLADVVRQEPTSKKENWAYYQCAVNADGVAVDVDFRLIRTKDI